MSRMESNELFLHKASNSKSDAIMTYRTDVRCRSGDRLAAQATISLHTSACGPALQPGASGAVLLSYKMAWASNYWLVQW